MDKRKLKPGMRIILKKEYTGTYEDYKKTYLVLSVYKDTDLGNLWMWVVDYSLSIYRMSTSTIAQYKLINKYDDEAWKTFIGGC